MTDELALKYAELKQIEAEEKEKEREREKERQKEKERLKETVKAKRTGLLIPVLFFLLIIIGIGRMQDQDIDHPIDAEISAAALSITQGKPRWKMLDQNVVHSTGASSVKSSQRPKSSPSHIPDYTAEIEKYVVNRCYRKLIKRRWPDLPAPNFRQIEKIKSVMWREVEKTTRQILPEVRGKPYKERMTVYDSAMGRCHLPY